MSGSTITAIGGNLFVLAAQYLGDATQWIRIAQINGIGDPFLIGQTDLVLPPVDPNAGGGVPNV
jgi:nucleoid-associated protein YgaU